MDFLRSGDRAVNLASELTVQSAKSLWERMASLSLKQVVCRWRWMLHRTCLSRAFPDPLGEKAAIPSSRCEKAEVPETPILRVDRYPHALVEPIRRCLLVEFESALASTRACWSKVHD